MDDTTFAVSYEVAAASPERALDSATDRLARSLAVGVEYVVRGERCQRDGSRYAVTLLVELTRVSPRIRTNLAFHSFFPRASVEAV